MRIGSRQFGVWTTAVCAAVLSLLLVGCAEAPTRVDDTRPNVLWIVWDTVRADRLSLYGYEKPTTPFLERWARDARVYEHCTSTAGSTVPSHASMFTGLLPSEHGAAHTYRKLDDELHTVAELFQEDGYATYLYAANPHIQEKLNFDQGFEVEEHPWSEPYHDRAVEIVRSKIMEGDESTNLPRRMRSPDAGVSEWSLMSTGELAETGLTRWLEGLDGDRPYFAFLNYMEAHSPYIPPLDVRREMMTEEQIERSLTVDNRAITRWSYCFGLHEYSEEDLDAIGATYDTTLLELDRLLEGLMKRLEDGGWLDNTVVVLVADHGEQLGEHHMIDHQFALYEPALHVPLVLWAPGLIEPGRSAAPVSNADLFPTLLELAGIEPPAGQAMQAVSLLEAPEGRARLSEYPTPFSPGIRKGLRHTPDWDPEPFMRRMRAYYRDPYKLICGSDGRHEVYELAGDPGESLDLAADRPELTETLLTELRGYAEGLALREEPADQAEFTETEKEMLRSLGYLGEEDEAPAEGAAATWGPCGP